MLCWCHLWRVLRKSTIQWIQYKHSHSQWSESVVICMRRWFKRWNRATKNRQANSSAIVAYTLYTNNLKFIKSYKGSIPLHNAINMNTQILFVFVIIRERSWRQMSFVLSSFEQKFQSPKFACKASNSLEVYIICWRWVLHRGNNTDFYHQERI